MFKIRNRSLRLVLSVAIAGTLLQFGGCSLDNVFSFLKDFNYGGSVLGIDPVTYQFYTSGYEGPGIDPEVDPLCTYPPYCNLMANAWIDPFSP